MRLRILTPLSARVTLVVTLVAGLSACKPAPPPVAPTVEQRLQGTAPAPHLVASFTGLGATFVGPQSAISDSGVVPLSLRNPSDNSLAVGPDHIIQTVNTRTAIFTKAGGRFDSTGKVLYGPVNNNNFFRGFGGPCEEYNNGDTVVRYDQLAQRWLVVMPIFRRLQRRENEPPAPKAGDGAVMSTPGNADQPGPATPLFIPDAPTAEQLAAEAEARALARERRRNEPAPDGSFAMCYAVSATSDPMGEWYRYEFVRPLFPDYPRPAVWPDGWYVPTSTGDTVIEKHACVAERDRMLRGEPAREMCVIVSDAGFLNNADLDGAQSPPPAAPNPVFATAGSQLNGVLGGSAIHAWNFFVDWTDAEPGSERWSDVGQTRLERLPDIAVEPYAFLCGGQLTRCVPQPGTDERLDSQGDKLMARVVYRRIGGQESVVAAHSVAVDYDGSINVDPAPKYGDGGFNEAPGGGVRWYEFRIVQQERTSSEEAVGEADRVPVLYQQGTYAPGTGTYRWMPSPAMDKIGNIGIGYSWGTAETFVGQRFAARTPSDTLGRLSAAETVLVNGSAAQEGTLRWEDYTQTAVDPTDDCTIWYVGDFVESAGSSYSTKIGAFRMQGC
ncbi:MAG: hypothetical protein R2832_14715 [Rhodothermales bacterium]